MGRLRSALLAEWRRLINSDSPGEVSSDWNKFHILDPKNGKIPTIKLTTKKIYDILIEKSDNNPVKRCQKWNLELKTSPIPWKTIWNSTYDNFTENKYCDLNWRVLHRALPLAPALYKQAKDISPACVLCDCDEHETLTHLFLNVRP